MMSVSIKLSIIIPVFNEEKQLPTLLEQLQPWLEHAQLELIFVDGGSSDGSYCLLQSAGQQVIQSDKGRANQMNAGAQLAKGELLLFLHADTQLPDINLLQLRERLRAHQKVWGRFDVSIKGKHFMFMVIAYFINWRSRLTGIATGDQAIFVCKNNFERLGAYKKQNLMEDVALSAGLKKYSWPLCIKQKVITSGRRWEKNGIARTIVLMWQLRFAYWRGVPADQLAKRYR